MKIKAVQLDLARQKENLEFIYSFIDFIKKHNFNTLQLYLEGIVKTKSFTRAEGRDVYEPEDILKIVNYASIQNINVIPVVSTLAHAELFLEHPDHKAMAELAGDTHGRWPTKSLEMTCPSNDQTYNFFQRYIGEVAELFPGEYFHVGLDEAWHLGMCDLCKKRFAEEGNRADDIFADHIKGVHAILKKFGKVMMMWDDMFEIYPTAIEVIPKDIIMCSWYYDAFSDRPLGHFVNNIRRDVFKEYDKLGLQYLLCPREISASNITTFTNYAKQYKPIGGIVTTWEKSSSFYEAHLPLIAFAGKLWNLPNENCNIDTLSGSLLDQAIIETTNISDKLAINAIKTYYNHRPAECHLSSEFAHGEVSLLEAEQNQKLELLLSVITNAAIASQSTIEDICISLKMAILNFKLRKAIYEKIIAKTRSMAEPNFSPLLLEMEAIRQSRLLQWNKLRAGISNKPLITAFDNYEKILSNILETVDNADHYLFVRFFLPDIWSKSWITLSVTGDDGKIISPITNATLKPIYSDNAYFEYAFPATLNSKPTTLRIESAGYGGQGISFIKILDRSNKRLVPQNVNIVIGEVTEPANMLSDDLRWSYFGDRNVMKGFRSSNLSNTISIAELSLTEEK